MRSRLGGLVAAGAAALLVVAIASCTSMTANEQWGGRPIREAIAKLGNPTNVIPAEGGGKTYLWILHRSVPVQNVTFDSQGNPIYSTAYRDSVRTLTFAVDPNGTIVTWNDSDIHPPM